MADYELNAAQGGLTGGGLVATVPPGGTVAHLAAAYAEGAGAFRRICLASGIVDPIPYPGPPPRRVRRVSLTAGAELAVPDPGDGLT